MAWSSKVSSDLFPKGQVGVFQRMDDPLVLSSQVMSVFFWNHPLILSFKKNGSEVNSYIHSKCHISVNKY